MMTDWEMVHWSQARQVTQLMGVKDKDAPGPAVTPDQHFAALIKAEQYSDAAKFLAHALPRYEAVLWAQRVLDKLKSDDKREPDEVEAMKTARAWVGEPVDALRRTAWEQAQAMDEATAEKLILQAIFLSGGSMAPEDLPAVHPAPDLAAKMASGAILVSTHRSEKPDKALAEALAIGEKLAQRAES